MSTSAANPRNPGPAWGFAAICRLERHCPPPLFQLIADAGSWVALAAMKEQRRHSRDYLHLALGRPPSPRELWQHFRAFSDFLVLRLRVARGVKHKCRMVPEDEPNFETFMQMERPALFGTFHFGRSDLLGFLLSERGRRVSMIRLKVGNSEDTRRLSEMFGGAVNFIWANDPANLIFAIKGALEEGRSLVMDCDRLELTSRTEYFQFLGRERLFPFTIYHLSLLFDRPVMFCFGVPDGSDGTSVSACPAFIPDPAAGRAVNLDRARRHFQEVLNRLESLLREHPALWFNFLPLNPPRASKP